MSNRVLTAGWTRTTPAVSVWEFYGPDRKVIGSVIDAGCNVYSLEAFGPQPPDDRKRPMHSGWSHYGGSLQQAKEGVLATLRDFGWIIEFTAVPAAPAEATAALQ